jgi:outer membrane protein TolC
MRFFAVLLSSTLMAAPQAPVPQAPAAPAPAQEISRPTLGAGAQANISPALANPAAPWIGSGAWLKKSFTTESKVTVSAPVKLKDYVVDGKLTLSLRAFLDLVISNNTDISILKVNLETPKNAIQRAFAVLDPTFNSTFTSTAATTPSSSSLEGAAVVKSLTQPFTMRFTQPTEYSTQLFSSLAWTKTSTNNSFQLFNPAYVNTWQMGFTQPLIRNRGRYITKLPITIARAQRAQQEISFEYSLQTSIVTAENAYWDVVSARENLKVQKEALKLAQASLDRTRQEIKLGATSELEVFQPEQNAATAQINLTRVEYQLRQYEDVLRHQIGADIDPDVRPLPIVLTEDVTAPPADTKYDRESLVGLAMNKRPDLRSVIAGIPIADLQIRTYQEPLKPLLNLSAYYQTYGRGGNNANAFGSPGDAWSQMFGFNYSTYNFSLTLSLPIRDRATSANLADAVVSKRLTMLKQRTTEQTVRQDVLNAITSVESSREGVRLAQIALDYAQKRADADQKRYDLGTITIFFLLSAQNDLTTAQSNLVTQTITYKRNLLNLQQKLGTLFEDKGIMVQ